MLHDPKVAVSTEAREREGVVCYVASADVRYRRRDGSDGFTRFEFEHRPFRSRDEAEAYARLSAVRHLHAVLLREEGVH